MGTPVDFWTLDDCVKALSDLDPACPPEPRPPPSKHDAAMSGFSANEDAIRQLLSERERDLEMAAQIGKRLLEQNKELEARLENLDEQLLSANDRAHQLQHELTQKEQLVQVYSRICEESQPEEIWSPSSPQAASPLVSPARHPASTSGGPKARGTPLSSGLDQLQRKIADLEVENNQLRVEHSVLAGRSEERKDRSLVEDCLAQLSEANSHIRKLSDELTQKTDKFMARQSDVTDLLERSLEMEVRVKQLTTENVVLNTRLSEAQSSQLKLSDHLVNIRDQYDECLKSLSEAHQEIRLVQQRQVSIPSSPAANPRPPVVRPPLPAVHVVETEPLSLAAELRASLEAEVEFEENVEHVRRCSYPWDARHSRSLSDSCAQMSGDSEEGSGESEEGLDERGDRERRSGRRRKASKVRAKRLQEAPSSTPRWRPGPTTDKVQMVKSMEGSQTLRTWQKLARPSMSGALFERRPGVRVRGCSGNRNSGGLGLGFGGLLSSDSEPEEEEKTAPVRFGLGGAGLPCDSDQKEEEEEEERRKREEERRKREEEERRKREEVERRKREEVERKEKKEEEKKAREEEEERKRLEAEAAEARKKMEASVEAEVAAITFRMSSEPPDPQRTLEKARRREARSPAPSRSPAREFPREFLREGADLNLSASAPSLAALLSECGIRSKTYEELLGEGFPMPPPAAPAAATAAAAAPAAPNRCPATPRNSPTAELEAADRSAVTAAPVNPVLVFTGLLESLSDIFRPFAGSPLAAPDRPPRRNASHGSGLEGLNAVTVPPKPPLPAVLHRTDSSAASPKR